MFYKLLITILALGLTAAALLVIRQQRIDHAHAMAQSHQRLVEHETQLWRLRAEVVSQCRPEDVREAIERSDVLWNAIPQRPQIQQPEPASYVDGDAAMIQSNSLAGG